MPDTSTADRLKGFTYPKTSRQLAARLKSAGGVLAAHQLGAPYSDLTIIAHALAEMDQAGVIQETTVVDALGRELKAYRLAE